MNEQRKNLAGAWSAIIRSSPPPRPFENPTHLVFDAPHVPPGAAVQITTRPQRDPLKPMHLYIEADIAAHFDIVDIVVGGRSQFAQSNGRGVPASRFSLRTVPVPVGDLIAHCEVLGDFVACETVQTAMDFVMIVTNRSDVERSFSATWTCEMSDPLTAFRRSRTRGADGPAQRIADLEAQREALQELQRASQARVNELQAELRARPATPAPKPPVSRALKCLEIECGGESAVASAPDRRDPIDRWQRGAPCTWDPDPES